MNLDDYIYNMKNQIKKSEPGPVLCYYELNSFKNVSEEKQNLIKQLFPHLNDRLFQSALERYDHGSSEYTYYQTYSENGIKALARVKSCDFVGNYCYANPVSARDFYKEYSKGKKVGSQRYTSIKIQTYHDVDGEGDLYMEIYYMDDGSVFINDYAAGVIEKMSVSQVGGSLAQVCLQLEENEERRRLYQASQRRRK